MNNQIILSYLNSLSYFTVKEVVSFSYYPDNTHLHVNFKSDSGDIIQWTNISVNNIQSYTSSHREILINQILE